MYNLKTAGTALFILSLSLVASCTQSSNTSSSNKISTSNAQTLYKEGNLSESSELYARVGESLLSSPNAGVLLAEEMFQKSLTIDSANPKANFYSAILAPKLTLKGFIPRFKKLHSNKKIIEKYESQIQDFGLPELTNFLWKLKPGTLEARELEDLRRFVRSEYAHELKNSLRKIALLEGKKFKLIPMVNENREEVCQVNEKNKIVECIDQGTKAKALSVTVDEHDVRALKVTYSTMRSSLLLGTTIGLQGYEDISAKVKAKSQKKALSDKDIVEVLATRPDFLRFEGSKEDLRELFLAKEEIIEDLIDFSKLRSELCNSSQRKDNLAKEICIDEDSADQLTNTLSFLIGPKEIVLGLDENGEEVSVEINLRALIDSGLTSLQDLMPKKFSKEGKALDYKDPTFAGIIPNGDLLLKLKLIRNQVASSSEVNSLSRL